MKGGESVRVAYPLFQTEGGGSTPTSPLQLEIVEVNISVARELNELWHSRLPVYPLKMSTVCFAAVYECVFYAAAIWSNPVHFTLPQHEWLELRRMAIAPDAPKNTASRMLSIMSKAIKRKFPHIIKLISYQDTEVHKGTIYKASGWKEGFRSKSGNWDFRGRVSPNSNPACVKTLKIRWEKDLV
jgi:hypothetical protein